MTDNNTDEDEPNFDQLDHLGEMDPRLFPELMRHPDTSISIQHRDEELLSLDGPSSKEITYPVMGILDDGARVCFKFDTMIPRIIEDDDTDESDDQDEITFTL